MSQENPAAQKSMQTANQVAKSSQNMSSAGQYNLTGGGATQMSKEQSNFGKQLAQEIGNMQAAEAMRQGAQSARSAGMSRGAAAMTAASQTGGAFSQGANQGLQAGMSSVAGGQQIGAQQQGAAISALSGAAGIQSQNAQNIKSPWEKTMGYFSLLSDKDAKVKMDNKNKKKSLEEELKLLEEMK